VTIGPDSIVSQDDEPIASHLDSEVVMLSVRAQSYFGLGEVGSEIWEMIAQPRRVAEICAEFVRRYAVEPAVCEREVVAFLTMLLQHRLIRLEGAAGPAP
jgi:hypothetical protein